MTHNAKSHQITTTGTNGKDNQPFHRQTNSDNSPSGYLKPRAKLNQDEPHTRYDASLDDTQSSAMCRKPAVWTSARTPVVEPGNPTTQTEGAKPLSRRKPRKPTPLMEEPPLQILERRAKLEIVQSSPSKRQRRRRQQAQFKNMAYANPEGKAVFEHTGRHQKGAETFVVNKEGESED